MFTQRIKHCLVTITMLLCSLVVSAHDFEVDGVYYRITSSANLTAEVTYRGRSSYEYSDEYSGTINIPSVVNYNENSYSVTRIGDYAFSECSNLTSVIIPEGVTSIGYEAFSYSYALTTINIPEGVLSIGHSAFFNCSNLVSITIPKSVTSILHYAFYGCSNLASITIPENVKDIGWGVFEGCI